ncbi:unnamed protein product [Orchesella dallaii]|uniref:Ankyrin repeat domain-containing protein 16 n=1 Tax=Orchesella dallaii TaxID=48710 RepID=A0ABP1QFB3_9HEXA
MGLSEDKCIAEHSAAYFRFVQKNQTLELREIVKLLKTTSKYQDSNVVNCLSLKKSGDTALHLCAINGYLDMMRYLVEEENANLEKINLEGKTALHDAAQFSQLEIVEYLLSKGANVNVVKRADWTPLMLACTKQNISVIQALVRSGADFNFINKDGWTCLHIAAREGNTDIISYLLESCKDGKLRKTLQERKSRNGRKPVHTAVMHGHLEVLKLLVAGCSSLELNEEDNCGTTPLMEACRFGFMEIIEYLIVEVGIDPQAVNKNGVGLLHVAAEANQGDVIKVLVNKYQVDINAASEQLLMTPLHWAAREGNLSAVKVLAQLKADTAIRDMKGRTPADLAEQLKKTDIIEFYNNYQIENKLL